MTEYPPYNPLDRINLAESIADALLESELLPLGELECFNGAGIYVIYYSGGFSSYAPLVQSNANTDIQRPIYVGKAVPKGSRQGGIGLAESPGPVLFGRLQEHVATIQAATSTLCIEDFHCRFLVVEDIWIPLGESLLIAMFAPIWNSILTGFGNHDPGKGRYKQKRSRWDVLHPGREWAAKCQARAETVEQITQEAETFLLSSARMA